MAAISFTTYRVLTEWLGRPSTAEEIKYLSLPKIQKTIKADTGHLIGTSVIKKGLDEFKLVSGIRRPDSTTRNMADRFSANALLARHLRSLGEILGYDFGEDKADLDKLVARQRLE